MNKKDCAFTGSGDGIDATYILYKTDIEMAELIADFLNESIASIDDMEAETGVPTYIIRRALQGGASGLLFSDVVRILIYILCQSDEDILGMVDEDDDEYDDPFDLESTGSLDGIKDNKVSDTAKGIKKLLDEITSMDEQESDDDIDDEDAVKEDDNELTLETLLEKVSIGLDQLHFMTKEDKKSILESVKEYFKDRPLSGAHTLPIVLNKTEDEHTCPVCRALRKEWEENKQGTWGDLRKLLDSLLSSKR